MKDYEEMAKSVLSRRDAYVVERKKRMKKIVTIGSCFCLMLLVCVGVWHTPNSNLVPEDVGTGNLTHGGDSSGYSAAPGLSSQKPDSTEISEQISTVQDEINTSPVYYSDLMLANGTLNEEALSFSEAAMMSLASFNESMLLQDHCCMIIEGTVLNLYVKHYTYDIYSDKFEENGILHSNTDTVVYEVAVDKTWYGEDISGDTILIEDTSYFTEPILAVKEGGRYVLPLYEYGNTIWTLGHEYAGGDITRETFYSTIYPYHPQIEVTNDGSYVVSQDWTTLIANHAREVIMDTLDDDDFWKDKMYLVDEKTFEDQMAILLSNLS